MNTQQVLEIFVDQGIVAHNQVDEITEEIASSGKPLVQVMIDYGFVTEEQFYQTIAEYLAVAYVDLNGFEPPAETQRLLPAGLAQLHKAFPLGIEDGALQVALCDPMNAQTAEDLRFALGKEIQVVVAPVWQIDDLIKKHYGTDSASMDEILAALGGEMEFGGQDSALDLKNLEAEANATPIIRYVDLIIYQAIQDRASDIHFEPFETEFKITTASMARSTKCRRRRAISRCPCSRASKSWRT